MKPLGHRLRSRGMIGKYCRLRGRLNSTVSPVWVSMLATVMLSVRTPTRSPAPSPPSSRMLTRGLSFHGSATFLTTGGFVSSAWKIVLMVSRRV